MFSVPTMLDRPSMSQTILELNSADTLTTFEALGQFDHGGLVHISFYESALIMSPTNCIPRPREEGGTP